MKRCSKFLIPMLEFPSNYDMGFSRWRLKLESIGIAVRRLWLCAMMELLSNLYLRFAHYTHLLFQHAWVSIFELTFQLLSNVCGIWVIVSFFWSRNWDILRTRWLVIFSGTALEKTWRITCEVSEITKPQTGSDLTTFCSFNSFHSFRKQISTYHEWGQIASPWFV